MRGALVIALLALAFLWRPIAQFDTGYFSPSDLSQGHALTRVEPGVRAGNVVVSDTWTQMQPWAMFDRDELARGRLPLWNRFNGGGVPHLANFQSAVFSPFTVPYYVLGLRAAMIASAFLKLWALGFFAFLLLRELRLSFWAATFGGGVYMFAGHQVLTLGYPHSGVSAALPAVLFALERLARRFEAGLVAAAHDTTSPAGEPSADPIGTTAPAGLSRIVVTPFAGPLALLVLALSLGVFAGHPETFYFVALFATVYAVVRGVDLWRRHRRVSGATQGPARLSAHVGVAVALAAGICAIQLLPFFEYLNESVASRTRTSGHQTPLPVATWPMQLFPNLLGNPANNYFVDDSLPRPGFETVNMGYVGGLALFLAVLAPFLVSRRGPVLAFLGAALGWIAYAYDVMGFARLLEHVPTLDVAPMNRSQLVFDLCIATAAAFTVDTLVDPARRRRVVAAVAVFGAGIVVVWLFRSQAFVLANRVKMLFPSGDVRDLITSGSLAHVEWITLTCIVGLAAIATVLVMRRGRARSWFGPALVAVAFVQSGALFAGYHPVTPDRFFYPRTAALDRLVDRVGTRDFVVLGKDGLPPATNMVYGLRQIANYDALSIRRYDQLYRRVFNDGGNWREIDRATSRGLQLFGVDYVLARDRWLPVDTAFAARKPARDLEFVTAGITPDAPFTQDLIGVRDGLEGVSFTWKVPTGASTRSIEVRLVDVETGKSVCTRRIEADEDGERAVPNGSGRVDDGRVECVPVTDSVDGAALVRCLLRFGSIPNSKGRAYRLEVAALEAHASPAPALLCRRDMAPWIDAAHRAADGEGAASASHPHPSTSGWRAQQSGVTLDGHLELELHHALESFVAVDRVADHTLFRFQDSCSRYHAVTHVVVARNDRESWNTVLAKGFDPRRTVVLEAVDPRLATVPEGDVVDEPVEIVAEDHGHVRLRTHRSRPGWLVTAQSWYPGWTARVCGVPVRRECANYAFTAVPLPAGECTIELDYAPKSVAQGAWISLVSLLLAAAWLAVSWRVAARVPPIAA